MIAWNFALKFQALEQVVYLRRFFVRAFLPVDGQSESYALTREARYNPLDP